MLWINALYSKSYFVHGPNPAPPYFLWSCKLLLKIEFFSYTFQCKDQSVGLSDPTLSWGFLVYLKVHLCELVCQSISQVQPRWHFFTHAQHLLHLPAMPHKYAYCCQQKIKHQIVIDDPTFFYHKMEREVGRKNRGSVLLVASLRLPCIHCHTHMCCSQIHQRSSHYKIIPNY